MKLKHILSKYQKYFLGIAIVLSSIAVSIRSHDGQVSLILKNYPVLIFLMIVISSFLVVIYLQINKRKIDDLSNQIKNQSELKNGNFNSLLAELTTRQKEVYDLIILGKTNKEIADTLFVSVNTIKTHILNIYDKLDVQNRTQAAVKAGSLQILKTD